MAKDPAFLWFPGDWLGGTMFFSRAHKGAYMDLLMAQFNNGHMAIQDIKDLLGNDFESMWESRLKAKFVQDEDGKYYNKKLENEILKRKKYVQSREENLKKTKSHKEVHIENHMKSHMENENENENINDNKKIPYNEIVSLYHKILPELPQVMKLSEKRKKQIKARWFESENTQSLKWWTEFFEIISQSKFLTGNNDRNWMPDLEWITKQENFLKICEGKYNR